MEVTRAIYHNDYEYIKKFLEEGADVNAIVPYKKYESLLHEAVRNNRYINFIASYPNYYVDPLIKMLLENGADINAKNRRGCTPLHLAVKYDNINAVKLLLENGADVNVKNIHQCTPLHIATYYFREKIVKILLEKETDINSKNWLGCTSLHLAANNGYYNIVKILLNKEADINIENNNGYTALYYAINPISGILCNLLKRKKDTNFIGTKALSIRKYDILDNNPGNYSLYNEIVKILVEMGADVSSFHDNLIIKYMIP